MRRGTGHPSRGFTLIEIIVTLVIVAVMGTMIYTYFGKAFSESATPVLQLQKYADLHRAMENIKSAYQKYPKWRSGASYVAGNLVIPSNPNGRYYECKAGGSCGSSSPDIDNGSNWTDKGLFMDSSYLTVLRNSIGGEGDDQDNAYGKYHVVAKSLIKFTQTDSDTWSEQVDASGKILKVTIENTTEDKSKYKLGGTVEALFYSY